MRHASIEVLSSYLDGELAKERQQRLERHLRGCEECQLRLEGLHRVVRRLEDLERVGVTPCLEQLVLQGVATRGRSESLSARLEKLAGGLHIERWVWMPTLGLVIALASIIYLFSWGLHHQERGLQVVVGAEAPPSEASEEPRAEVSETLSQRAEGSRSLSVEAERDRVASPGAGLAPTAPSRAIDAREFLLQDGIWIERGIDPSQPPTLLDPVEAAAPLWRGRLPNLSELERLGGPVRLRVGDQLVQVEFTRLP
jgi:anti-sigma factor RsiW